MVKRAERRVASHLKTSRGRCYAQPVPELPEVEVTRRSLLSLHGQQFSSVRSASARFSKVLQSALNRRIESIDRRGKYLLFALGEQRLVIHLGMSGRLFISQGAVAHPHHRWSLRVSDGSRLVFIDRRRFGRFCVVGREVVAYPGLAALGPEPFERKFGPKHLHHTANATRRSIKTVLLDQRVVAGLGNIYVDEALHAARIHPCQVGLTHEQARLLVSTIKRILRAAVELGGTSFSLHKDGLVPPGLFTANLRVFGRAGSACACGAKIIKIVHAARGTHLCPSCQMQQLASS